MCTSAGQASARALLSVVGYQVASVGLESARWKGVLLSRLFECSGEATTTVRAAVTVSDSDNSGEVLW